MSINIDRIVEASRPTDADIDAEFSPATQARILDDIVGAGNVIPLASRGHSRRWLGLVAAGVVVAVGGLTVQALLPSRTTTVVTQDPSGGVTTVTVTQPPVGLPAAAALEPIAQVAAVHPVATPKNAQFLHVVQTDTQDGRSVTHDMYVANDGWTWRTDTEGGRITLWMLYDAKIKDYGKLPTDPVALDAVLRKGTGNNSGDERVFKAVSEILNSQTATSAVRAAAIRVLDTTSKNPQAPVTTSGMVATPKITLERVTVNGRDAVKVSQTDATSRPGVTYFMVLDAETSDQVQVGTTAPDSTFAGTVTVRELVDTLPADLVSTLGTKRVHKEIQ
jgi:hypothetical protein